MQQGIPEFTWSENALKVRLFRARQRVLKAFEARRDLQPKEESD